jgi:hypothetical protein
LEEANKPPCQPKYTKGTKNRRFPALIDLKMDEKAVFYSKVLIRYTPKIYIEECMNFKNLCYLR